jgi:hypothetical protein
VHDPLLPPEAVELSWQFAITVAEQLAGGGGMSEHELLWKLNEPLLHEYEQPP